MINNILDLCIHDLSLTLDDCFYKLLVAYRKRDFNLNVDEISKTFDKSRRLMRIYGEMQGAKYENIDWNRACDDGFFCLKDYYIFKELKDLKQKGIEKYLNGGGTQENVDSLERKYAT